MLRLPFCTHCFTLSGLNLERFVQLLLREGIALRSVRRTDARTLTCECLSADLQRIADLAQSKGLRLRDARPLGLSRLLAFFRKRPGVPVGALLMLLMAAGLSQFIWNIEIHHAGAYRAEISSALSQMKLTPGTPRSAVDAEAVERELTYRYPQIAWFHVYVSGMTLVVDVTHGVAMPSLPDSAPSDVIATRGGVVDAMRVFSGTAAVRPGDVVKSGQVLIRGEERGPDGTTVPVHASGEVTARCWQSETVLTPLYEVRSEETGRETTQTRIWTPWITLPMNLETPAYLASNTYLSQTPIGGCFFPVALQTLRLREVQMEYAPRSEQKALAEGTEAALKRLKSKLDGYELIDKWAESCMIEGNTLAVTATVEWLMDIGGETPS